jgi:hypothetical protein
MLIRTFAAVALATFAAATAQAGTIQNGTWTPSGCTDPGDVPHLNSKNADAFNKSAKVAQEWQGKAKVYADCLNGEAKADQQAIITGANGAIGKINDEIKAMGEEQAAAVEKLKKAGASQH